MPQSAAATMDMLAIVFFAVAGVWLLAALFYSIMVLLFLRMRSRNELGSIYDEDFGRVYLCNNRNGFYIPLGWLFRRYARHLQLETSSSEGPGRDTHYMTPVERRTAMERLLLQQQVTNSKKKQQPNPMMTTSPAAKVAESVPPAAVVDKETGSAAIVADGDDDASTEGPICSICLGPYNDTTNNITTNAVLAPKTCSHIFHEECILDWLQRPGKTECPCCREHMVEEGQVWKMVKKQRTEKKQQLRRERRKLGRPAHDNAKENDHDDVSQTEEMQNDADDVEMAMPPSSGAAAAPSSEANAP